LKDPVPAQRPARVLVQVAEPPPVVVVPAQIPILEAVVALRNPLRKGRGIDKDA